MLRHSVGGTFRVDLTRYRDPYGVSRYASREVSTLIDRLVSDAEARAGALLDEKQQEHEAAVTAILAQIDQQAREHDTALTAARAQFDAQIREQAAALTVARAQFEAQALEQDVALTEARAQLERQIREHDTALTSAGRSSSCTPANTTPR